MSTVEYECALTGVVEQGGQIEKGEKADGLEDLPVGWTKITIQRRTFNPKWLLIQQVKEAMIEGLLSQVPADIQQMQRYAIMLQVEAQFHALEQATSMYAKDVDDIVYISDSGELIENINEMRELLGLDAIGPIPTLDDVGELSKADEDDSDAE